MRQWRVGTWSMGIALTIMGVLLVTSQFNGSKWLDQGLLWWPLLFMLVGLEILVYLWRSPGEHPVLRYDLFSMFFIGLIGAGSLLFTTASATGIVDELRSAIGAREVRTEVKPIQLAIPPEVGRIVVQGEHNWNGRVLIDPVKMKSPEVNAFGACRYTIGKDEQQPEGMTMISTHQAGDTLYLTASRPIEERLLFNESSSSCTLTVVLPADTAVEVQQSLNASLVSEAKLPAKWKFTAY
ncbi:hypothetical protein [Paenibacillus spongiae]|uniref:DUF5668 domain-containing protein n=1 Tax=Paenibacillus spongiae TaxID=2909671 RepID=A0ABY5S7M1_9BACL|nr:hypothetical protein [Paenibacillus spongiae]UVI29904.1 hypothetical protein L1F29_31730 [Paenibacillus spongiae]